MSLTFADVRKLAPNNTMNTLKAIWFSRHQPSPEQIEDAKRLGFDLAMNDRPQA